MSPFVFSNTQMDKFTQLEWHRFSRKVAKEMSDNWDDFAKLDEASQSTQLREAFTCALEHDFQSERALAFWANVTWKLPKDWHLTQEIQAALSDRKPNEPERLYRLKLALEEGKWAF